MALIGLLQLKTVLSLIIYFLILALGNQPFLKPDSLEVQSAASLADPELPSRANINHLPLSHRLEVGNREAFGFCSGICNSIISYSCSVFVRQK